MSTGHALREPSDYQRWNSDLIECLREKDLLRYIMKNVLQPKSSTAANRWVSHRFNVIDIIRLSLSPAMQEKVRKSGGGAALWATSPSEADPKKVYDMIRELMTQEGKENNCDKEPPESSTTIKDWTKKIEVAEPENVDEEWTSVDHYSKAPPTESIQDRVVRVTNDLRDLKAYYDIEGSVSRNKRLEEFYRDELADLERQPFASYASQDDRVDYLLLRNYLRRAQRTLELDEARDAKLVGILGTYATIITAWCEERRRAVSVDPKAVAHNLHEALKQVQLAREHIVHNVSKYSRATGHRAARRIAALRSKLTETYNFYNEYDPSFDWWVTEMYEDLSKALDNLVEFLREVLVGIKPGGDSDAIVGEPIGRDGLLSDLEAEMIPYTPEELLQIAEKEYTWCEREMIKASEELDFHKDWRSALEHVKDRYESPSTYPAFIRSLIDESAAYVKKHDLVTVPRIAEEAIRMTMIGAEQQKVSPFFLGGTTMQMAYPTREMPYDAKLMSMRANNRHFSRATALHEMIPGHHLQVFIGERHRHYRRPLFDTPFYVEGWAMYWEMVLWERGDFFRAARDKVGTLFWRMHRCARILFSVQFHLGRLSPEQCVDLLVEKVGHERSTAEGEVRRSLAGEYSPLYQAGYMLGALQMMKLRKEALEEGKGGLREKEFHDIILKANTMPIEMLRALILDTELKKDFKSEWRFYDK